MDSFYTIICYPIIFILSPFSTNHITSYLGSRVDMVSKLDPIFMIFTLTLFNNYLTTSAKCLGDIIINVYRNYYGFYIGSALRFDVTKILKFFEIGRNHQKCEYVFTDYWTVNSHTRADREARSRPLQRASEGRVTDECELNPRLRSCPRRAGKALELLQCRIWWRWTFTPHTHTTQEDAVMRGRWPAGKHASVAEIMAFPGRASVRWAYWYSTSHACCWVHAASLHLHLHLHEDGKGFEGMMSELWTEEGRESRKALAGSLQVWAVVVKFVQRFGLWAAEFMSFGLGALTGRICCCVLRSTATALWREYPPGP